jgi:hypothetical protein
VSRCYIHDQNISVLTLCTHTNLITIYLNSFNIICNPFYIFQLKSPHFQRCIIQCRLLNLSYISFLWLYSPILGIGRLHKAFRFISVTRSRTVGRTPWTGDQLVARPLLTALVNCDDREVGWGNRSTRRKPAPMPLCPPQIPLARPGHEPDPPRWEASD